MQVLVSDDFDLRKIADSGQCFRAKELAGGMFRFITGDSVLYIRPCAPQLFDVSCTAAAWETVWLPYFDLGRSYGEIARSIPASDPYLRQAAKEGRGIRVLRQDPWEVLITFIISQRKSIPAIKAAVELLSEKYGRPVVTPYETLYTFPAPRQLAQAEEGALTACKLGYRVPYIQDAAEKVASGELDLERLREFPDAELFERLKTVRGVGDKVASCIGLFAYGRTAAVPVDTWIRKVIEVEYGGRNPFPAYGENAGIMQQYAFFHALSHKDRFAPGRAAAGRFSVRYT